MPNGGGQPCFCRIPLNSAMLCFALTSPAVRRLCESAARRSVGAAPIEVQVGAALPAAVVLLHDFLPDAARSCSWLSAGAVDGLSTVVIAILDTPASAALHAISQHAEQFACADIALASEANAASIATVIDEVLQRTDCARVTQLLSSAWSIDPLLTTLARQALTINGAGIPITTRQPSETLGTWPTEAQLLALTGVTRATFVRHAHRAGFTPALRFLHVLRVLAVASALRAGRATIECVAARYGYTSTGTLRRHFHEITGLVPSSARHLSMPELVHQIREIDRRSV